MQVAVLNNRFIVVSENSAGLFAIQCEPQTKQWLPFSLPPLLKKQHELTRVRLVVSGEKLYLLLRGEERLELYVYHHENWHTCNSLEKVFADRQGCWDAKISLDKTLRFVAVHNSLYLFGRDAIGTKLYQYTPQHDAWQPIKCDSCALQNPFGERRALFYDTGGTPS